MYSKSIPFKDFHGKPRNQEVHFNLTEPEVFKLLKELKTIFEWTESMGGDVRNLETEAVVTFYTAFENFMLAAWGEPSEDGLHFRKSGRYEFEESALFAATMLEFVTNPAETTKLVDAIMPKGLQDIVKNADANLQASAAADGVTPEAQAEIARLRSQLAAIEGTESN